MVHNGIEYGIMAAYAEGMGILRSANIGKQTHESDAETTPAARSRASINSTSTRAIVTEVRWRGSVIVLVAAGFNRERARRRSGPVKIRGPGLGFRRRPLDHQSGHR